MCCAILSTHIKKWAWMYVCNLCVHAHACWGRMWWHKKAHPTNLLAGFNEQPSLKGTGRCNKGRCSMSSVCCLHNHSHACAIHTYVLYIITHTHRHSHVYTTHNHSHTCAIHTYTAHTITHTHVPFTHIHYTYQG